MTKNEKAVANLLGKDIFAMIDTGTVYIGINDTYLEISEAEINFQASQYEEDYLTNHND